MLGNDEADAKEVLPKTLACVRESWEPKTTARNLGLIREAREQRGEVVSWASRIEESLLKRATA